MSGSRSRSVSLLGLAAVLAVWVVYSLQDSSDVFPSPWAAAVTGWQLLADGTLVKNILISLRRVFLGFAFGLAAGLVMGVLVGLVPLCKQTIYHLFELLRPIPTIAWLPIAVLWFGIGEASMVFVIFTGAFFPVFVSTARGILSTDPTLVWCAKAFGASSWRVVRDVVLPSALADILTGQRLGLSFAFIYMVAAELISAQSGLGYMIMHARTLGNLERIPVGLLTIGLLNLVFNSIQRRIEQYLIRWQAGLGSDRTR